MATKMIPANDGAGNGATGTEAVDNRADAATAEERPSGAAGDVWDALRANPGSTAATLTERSGVSRATVTRALNALERDGRATRTRGEHQDGTRQPDLWHLVTDTSPSAEGAPDVSDDGALTGGVDTKPPVATDAPTTDPTGPAAVPPTGSTGGGGHAEAGLDAAAVAEARDALTKIRDAVRAALDALDGGDPAAARTATEEAYSGSGRARRLVRIVADGRPRNASGAPRSAPGEMRAKVAAHLTAHPEAAFTANEVAKAIGHSAGAVSNALDRLFALGEATLVCERPRRFTAASTRPASR
ncbi:winged helix-turn-helix domain-containing protein [Actinomadura litoris]|nr:winged helix-turn-helix domain-containing protein [Actinomadura litoris]